MLFLLIFYADSFFIYRHHYFILRLSDAADCWFSITLMPCFWWLSPDYAIMFSILLIAILISYLLFSLLIRHILYALCAMPYFSLSLDADAAMRARIAHWYVQLALRAMRCLPIFAAPRVRRHCCFADGLRRHSLSPPQAVWCVSAYS